MRFEHCLSCFAVYRHSQDFKQNKYWTEQVLLQYYWSSSRLLTMFLPSHLRLSTDTSQHHLREAKRSMQQEKPAQGLYWTGPICAETLFIVTITNRVFGQVFGIHVQIPNTCPNTVFVIVKMNSVSAQIRLRKTTFAIL